MKIRVSPGHVLAGPDVTHAGGDLYDLPEAQAMAVVLAGHATPAEAIRPTNEPETAEAPVRGETASPKSTRGKKG